MIQQIKEEIADLKTILKYYHGEKIRKLDIDNRIAKIESLIEELNKKYV